MRIKIEILRKEKPTKNEKKINRKYEHFIETFVHQHFDCPMHQKRTEIAASQRIHNRKKKCTKNKKLYTTCLSI